MLLAGLTTCSTWSLIPRSWRWPGRGCGAIGVRARRGGRHDRPLHRRRARGGAVPVRPAGRFEGRPVHPAASAGTDDPEVEWETATAGHPDRPGPGRPGGPETGSGADLRGRLPAVLARL